MLRELVRWRLAGVLVAGPLLLSCEPFSPEPYLEDLAQLEAFTATTYANFEWAMTESGFDPVAARLEARRAIDAARSRRQAVRALHELVDSFGDGHFRLRPERVDEGDGSDWLHPTAALLTEKSLVGNGRSVVRHAHWQGVLAEMAADVDLDLAREELSAGQRRLLDEVRARLEAAMAEAAERCDLSLVWERGAGELPCTLLVRDKLFTTGLLAARPEVDTEGLSSRAGLFKALEYGERPAAWRGPLAVLLDHDTASASELFAALLRDNAAAVLIGTRTYGAGCGYTNGGIQTVLEHSRLEVWVPDCVRHRRGGGNERAGIAPDLEVDPVRGEGRARRGERFRARLEEWVAGLVG